MPALIIGGRSYTRWDMHIYSRERNTGLSALWFVTLALLLDKLVLLLDFQAIARDKTDHVIYCPCAASSSFTIEATSIYRCWKWHRTYFIVLCQMYGVVSSICWLHFEPGGELGTNIIEIRRHVFGAERLLHNVHHCVAKNTPWRKPTNSFQHNKLKTRLGPYIFSG